MAGDVLSRKRRKRLEEFVELLQVKPGSHVNLAHDFAPDFKAGVKRKKDGVALLEEGIGLMCEYQARLAAQETWGVLVVLQALDAAGKDGTIRHVMSGVNPQGVSVSGFKVPSAEEARSRLPLALPAPPARARTDRNLQSLLLRGGAGRPGSPGEPRAPEAPGGG